MNERAIAEAVPAYLEMNRWLRRKQKRRPAGSKAPRKGESVTSILDRHGITFSDTRNWQEHVDEIMRRAKLAGDE